MNKGELMSPHNNRRDIPTAQRLSRSYYSDRISTFRSTDDNTILGKLSAASEFPDKVEAKHAWLQEIRILKGVLRQFEGRVFFEFSIPRMGLRIDVVLLIGPVIFVLEFKIGERRYNRDAIDQVFDYALDLKNFHETSHAPAISPILIAEHAKRISVVIEHTQHQDGVLFPIKCNATGLAEVITEVLHACDGPRINCSVWERGRYYPTPTIVEAAMALYRRHTVADISRRDASARNLTITSKTIANIIQESKAKHKKSIVFVTGVPGAGKTLVGLNTATEHIDRKSDLFSVFLSGNGPLVHVLQEALARDKVRREKTDGGKGTKKQALSEVKLFVQNVHHFRDECLVNMRKPPLDHVALFDEAQRAWNLEQTRSFMSRKKGSDNFKKSEPEFLISCLNRHKDWAVIVCLVGGGQEINTGEAGIGEWIRALKKSYPSWYIYISPRLTDSEYGAQPVLRSLHGRKKVVLKSELHLSVSMRSFRAEKVSLLVKQLLDLEESEARKTLSKLSKEYPIVLTRDIDKAKSWLRRMARGSERYGIVASSNAERLRAHGIFVKAPMDPVHWFLDPKEDVRSSFYLEDVATEFSIQGLELDWSCVTWDADFRYSGDGWHHHNFVGRKWNNIKKDDRKAYQKNAYRVLLTRARQGMVIVVPKGDKEDPTRLPQFYDPTYEYLKQTGFASID